MLEKQILKKCQIFPWEIRPACLKLSRDPKFARRTKFERREDFQGSKLSRGQNWKRSDFARATNLVKTEIEGGCDFF